MFLQELSKPSQAFFLELVFYSFINPSNQSVASEEEGESNTSYYDKPLLARFLNDFTEDKINTVIEIAKSIDLDGFAKDYLCSYPAFPYGQDLWAVYSIDIKDLIVQWSLKPNVSDLAVTEIKQKTSIVFLALPTIINIAIQIVLDRYSQKSILREKITEYTIENGGDINTITRKTLRFKAVTLPAIRQEIVSTILNTLIEVKEKSGFLFTIQEKKAILYELIAFWLDRAIHSEALHDMMLPLFSAMQIDLGYIEEFEEAYHKLHRAQSDLTLLINE